MTTLGSQAVQDVCHSALNVVAAFKGDSVVAALHPVQRKCLEDLEAACRFLFDLTAKEKS